MYDDSVRDTSSISLKLFRLLSLLVFGLLIGRLYQLQIIQGADFQDQSEENRERIIEIPAARGVIYDRNGEILARNKPSFEIAVVPAYLTEDDIETPDNEEIREIEEILVALHADTDPDTAVRVADTMFRLLGRSDYAKAVESQGITLKTIMVPGPLEQVDPGDGGPPIEKISLVPIPDTTVPLPIPALAALVDRAVQIKRAGSTSEPITIMNLVDRIRAFEVEEESYRLPGVQIRQAAVRDYVYGAEVSHILGFMGPIPASYAEEYVSEGYSNPSEKVGLSGLEFTYQQELRGTPGHRTVDVDILGREVRTVGEIVQPIPGQHLHLSIDRQLQKVMYQALEAKMQEVDAPWGVTIAMNPQNGAILGMVSLPSFDNNIFAEGLDQKYLNVQNDERRPLINYAIGGLYPPGSVFKMVSATAALQEGIIGPNETIVDNGPLFLPNRFAPDNPSLAQKFVSWNHKLGINHGPINIVQALALSNDIYFYMVGGGYPPTDFKGLGDAGLAKWMGLFGYGDPTGIDIPGEVGAVIPNDRWKRQTRFESWTTGDSYNMAIGQGDVLVTPLQVLVATAAVANGGLVYHPQIVYQITDADGKLVRDFEPHVIRQLPVDPGNMDVVRQGMWSAVNSDFGTAIEGRLQNVEVAAKTGTAEFCEWDQVEQDCRYRDKDDNLPTHAWYVAFAPYENPEIIVVTFVYHGGEGSATALPVVTDILRYYFGESDPNLGESEPNQPAEGQQ